VNVGDSLAFTVTADLSNYTSLCRNLPLSFGNERTNKKQSIKAYYQRQESKNRPLLTLYDTGEPCYQRTYAKDTMGNKKDSKLNRAIIEFQNFQREREYIPYDDQNHGGG
jgi:hypothetical protein